MTVYDCTEAIRNIPWLTLMEIARVAEQVHQVDPPVRKIEVSWYSGGEIASTVITAVEIP